MSDSFRTFDPPSHNYNIHYQPYGKQPPPRELMMLSSVTIEDVMRHISQSHPSRNVMASELCVYVKHGKTCIPLAISYENYELQDPSTCTTHDSLFVTEDGKPRMGPPKHLHLQETLCDRLTHIGSVLGKGVPTLYYITLPDFVAHHKDIFDKDDDVSEDIRMRYFYYGCLSLYWDLQRVPTMSLDILHKGQTRECATIRKQQSLMDMTICKRQAEQDTCITGSSSVKPYPVSPQCEECIFSPELIIHESQADSHVNILALFQEFVLSKRIPYMRLYTDDYLDSCCRVRKDSLQTNIEEGVHERCISQSQFEIWTKRIPIHNGFETPLTVDMKNTLTFVIYDETYTYPARLCLSVDGHCRLLFQKDKKNLITFTDVFRQEIMSTCQSHIFDVIHKQKMYVPSTKPLQHLSSDPSLIQGTYYFPISSYKRNIIKTIFENMYTYFAYVPTRSETLQFMYLKTSYSQSREYQYPFLTNINRLKMDEKDMKTLLCHRFLMSKDSARNVYQEWERLTETHRLPAVSDVSTVSLVIHSHLDTISVRVLGATCFTELHLVMSLVARLISLYRAKINKEEIPVYYQSLFQKQLKQRNAYITQEQPLYVSDEDDEVDQDEVDQDEVDQDESEEDESDDYGGIDSDESDEILAASKYRTMRGGTSDDSFTNKRYMIGRLEAADPELFTFASDTKDTYPRKCQANASSQPLVLTKKELQDINSRLKKIYGDEHIDIGYKEYHIDRRNPEIVYLCPEYWDRKHQLIFPKGTTEDMIHPLENKPIKDLSYDTRHSGKDRFIIKRTKDKPEITFIQNLHPLKYGLPCCGKKPTTYTVGQKVNVLVRTDDEYGWSLGIIRADKDKDDMFLVNVDSDTFLVHISRIEKYKESKKQLIRVSPLPENSVGHVSDVLKNYFYIPHESPDLSQPYNDGFYRVGVTQDNEPLLHSLHALIQTYRTMTFRQFKQAILDSIDEMPMSCLAGGYFTTLFHKDGPEPSLQDVRPTKRARVIQDHRSHNARQQFEKYLLDTHYKKNDTALWITLLSEMAGQTSHLFGAPISLVVVVFEEINDTVRIVRPYRPFPPHSPSTHYCYLRKHESLYEPLMYKYHITPYAFLTSEKDTLKSKGQYCIHETLAIIQNETPVTDEILRLRLTTDEIVSIPKIECELYDRSCIIRDTRVLLDTSYITRDKREPLSYEETTHVIDLLNRTYHKTYTYIARRSHYHDQLNQCTHVVVQDTSHSKPETTTMVIPILPQQPSFTTHKIHPVDDLPKVYLPHLLEFYKMFDEMILATPLFDHPPYVTETSCTLLCNSQSKMTDFLFDNGTVIPLLVKPLGSYYKGKIKDYHPRDQTQVSLTNQSVGKVSRRSILYDTHSDFRERCHVRHQTTQQSQYEMSLLSVYVNDHPSLRAEMTRILTHPLILPIRKKQRVCDMLMSESHGSDTWSLDACKKYIDICQNNGITQLPTLYRSLMDVRQPKQGEYVCSQREILNDNHVFYFQEVNPYKRNITLYGVYQEIPLAVRPTLQQNDPVSLITKYPAQLTKYLGPCLIYTHILEEYISDISSVAYALSVFPEGLTQDTLEGFMYDYSVETLTPDALTLLSSYLWDSYKLRIGFVVYSNDALTKTNEFHLSICMSDEIIQGESLHSDIQCICLYQDVGSPFKNIVFERDEVETSVIPLQELCQQKLFMKEMKKLH